MKTKVKFNKTGYTNGCIDYSKNDVGYIDGYVASQIKIYACIIIGNKLVYAEADAFDIITENEFVRADQNTRITV